MIEINKYLADSPEIVSKVLELTKGSSLALVSPTGSGKTTLFTKHIPKEIENKWERIVIAIPTISIGKNKEGSELPFYYDGDKPTGAYPPVCVCTYNNLMLQDLDNTLVVIDEAHRFSMDSFRMTTLAPILEKVVRTAYATVYTSATLEQKVWEKVIPNLDVINVKVAKPQTKTITLVERPVYKPIGNGSGVVDTEGGIFDAVLSILDMQNKNKLIIYIQNKEILQKINVVAKNMGKHPIIYTAEEGKLTVSNDERATEMMRKGQVPDECKVMLFTSAAWEGFDIIDPKYKYDVVVGITSRDNQSMLPAIIMQMGSRPRLQYHVNVVVLKNTATTWHKTKPTEVDYLKAEKSIHTKVSDAKKLQAVTTDDAFRAVVTPEGNPTLMTMLLEYQSVYDSMIRNGGWQKECERYGFKLQKAEGNANVVDSTSSQIDFEVVGWLLVGDEIYDHTRGEYTPSPIERLLNDKLEAGEVAKEFMKRCKKARVNAYPTFEVASRICDTFERNKIWNEDKLNKDFIKDIVTHYRWLQEPKNKLLEPVRVAVWKKWEGKEVTYQEFVKWVKTLTKLDKDAKKRLLSKRVFSDGIVGKLFKVEKKTVKGQNIYTLHNGYGEFDMNFVTDYRVKIYRRAMQVIREEGTMTAKERKQIQRYGEMIEQLQRENAEYHFPDNIL